jgi:murein DD-endopeptidase MepM/ murein hydrolase activator NlpD
MRDLPSGVIERVPDVVDWHERIPWGLPVSLERGWVSSEFSMSRIHPVSGVRRPHYGIDLAVDAGTPIRATARGVVTFAGGKSGYGLLVIVDHENGFSTRYAHCSKLLVKASNQVERGETIALAGATGNVTGEHLHYEVRINGEAVNPRRYLPEGLPTERPPGM